MKKRYVSPDLMLESFVTDSSFVCASPSGILQGTGDNSAAFSELQ